MTEKTDRSQLLEHLIDRCSEDPLYMTKILVSSLWKNILNLLLRIAVYMAAFYVMTEHFDLERSAAGIILLGTIVAIYTLRSVFEKINNNVSGVSDGRKGDSD